MNPNLKDLRKKWFETNYKYTDISLCFEQVAHYCKRFFYTHKFNLVQALAKKNFDFEKRKEWCTISQLTKDVPIEFILR